MTLPYTVTEHGDLVPLTIVSPDSSIGVRTKIYAFTTIEENVIIGHQAVVGSNVFIGSHSVIGEGTRVQHGAFICRGSKIGKNVFIGPLACLTDDKYPRVQTNANGSHKSCYKAEPPILEDGCSIGAGAIILPGVTIGKGAMVGAGAVVTKDVGAGHTVLKVPAEIHAKEVKLVKNTGFGYHEVPREGFGID